ncbi:MAG: hypothetical protein A2284_18005 [Deltaproteobacteria bacterium RIFOXYA12_FULL_61_11]|nr:MAG: hypothetical protein A2284_18005 [Deltaproteobacteria bacterium RIFOXYA12_FULL_61_11]
MAYRSFALIVLAALALKACGGGNNDDDLYYQEPEQREEVAQVEPDPPETDPPFQLFPTGATSTSVSLALVLSPFSERRIYSFEMPAGTDFTSPQSAEFKVPVKAGEPLTIEATGWINDGAEGHFGYFLPGGDEEEVLPYGKGSAPNGALLALFSADGLSYDLSKIQVVGDELTYLPAADGTLAFVLFLPHDEDPTDNTGAYYVSVTCDSFLEAPPDLFLSRLSIPQGLKLYGANGAGLRDTAAFHKTAEAKAALPMSVNGRSLTLNGLTRAKTTLVYAKLGEYRSRAIEVTPLGLSKTATSVLELEPERVSFKSYHHTQALTLSNKGSKALNVILVPGNPILELLDPAEGTPLYALSIPGRGTRTIDLALPVTSTSDPDLNPGLCDPPPPAVGFASSRDLSILPFGSNHDAVLVLTDATLAGKSLRKAEDQPYFLLPLDYTVPGPVRFKGFSLLDESDDRAPYPSLHAKGIIEAGETVRFSLELINEGRVAVPSYSAYVTSLSEHVTTSQGEPAENLKLDYPTIEAGTGASPLGATPDDRSVVLRFSPDLLDGVELRFAFQGVDSTGLVFPCQEFDLIVSKVGPVLLEEVVIDDDAQGRSNQTAPEAQDGKLTAADAGRTVEVLPNFRNPSGHDIGALTLTLSVRDDLDPRSTSSALATIPEEGGRRIHPGLPARAQDPSPIAPFFFTLAPDYEGQTLFFHLNLETEVSFPSLPGVKAKRYVFRAVFDQLGRIYEPTVVGDGEGATASVHLNRSTGAYHRADGQEISAF